MRRIVGALILLGAAVFLRADDMSHYWKRAEGRVRAPGAAALDSVPGRGRAKRRPSRPKIPASFQRDPLVFLSSAPTDSLILLPGVGPVLAERIVNARTGKRPFIRWEDLLAIKGIGPKTIERLKKLAAGENP
jgi:predicted flap endonuclease-1-like 5' DNA nuclease